MKYLLSLCFVLLLWSASYGQLDSTYNDNRTYMDNIESVQFYAQMGLGAEDDLNLPIIRLDSDNKLMLEFDNREGGFTNYLYRIVHCDKDWYFSSLDEIEYIDGFNDEEIDDFGYSSNAYSEYTHYSLSIPNDDIKWTISGNYMLFIYEEDTNLPVLSRRFIISEKVVSVFGQISKPQDISLIRSHNEISVSVDYRNFRIMRPLQEVFVTVMQNGNGNSAYHNIQGTNIIDQTIMFDDYDLQVTFPALKEFRSCDIRSLQYRSEFVHSIERNDNNTNVLMDLDKKRADKHYQTEPDANGGYIIDNKDSGTGGDTNSEYANVIFSLEVDRPYLDEVYLVGAFSEWRPKDKFRLDYDTNTGIYTKDVELKQGYYDYMYGILTEDGMLELAPIEGSWYETENEYQMVVYYREIGGEYDRVLDVATLRYQF